MNLFWKIFIWFWSAMVVMGAALFGIATATRPDPLPAAWRQATSQALSVYAAQTVEAYEKGGTAALDASLQRLSGHGPTRLRLYDAMARPLSREITRDKAAARGRGRSVRRMSRDQLFDGPLPDDRLDGDVPDGEMQNFDSLGRRDGYGPDRGEMPDHVRADLNFLIQRAIDENTQSAQFALNGRTALVAQTTQDAAGRVYVLAGQLNRPPEGRAPIQAQTLWLGLGALLLMSTLLCYGLARTVTSPIYSLRVATRRLAQGDLGARVGNHLARRDELADLNRDFDDMAARIETLMTAQHNLVEAQRRLLGDVSHELRSPLTRLSVALALARHHETAPEAHSAHERIGGEIVRLNELIGQLLQLARLENMENSAAAAAVSSLPNSTALVNEREVSIVDLPAIVRDVVADAQFEASEKNRSVHATLTPCQISGNGALLHSAIENVVRNAIRHTRVDTQVEVRLNCENDVAILSVRDWGEGVPEASLSELFKPFYRVEAARDRESGGAGLGLSITERAVRWHCGSVRAENVPPHGLCVEITLPVMDELPTA